MTWTYLGALEGNVAIIGELSANVRYARLGVGEYDRWRSHQGAFEPE
jgi:hypothetical protein